MENNEALENEQVEQELQQTHFTVTDIAERMGMSRQRVHQIIQQGKLTPDIITANGFIFKRKTVERFAGSYKKRASR